MQSIDGEAPGVNQSPVCILAVSLRTSDPFRLAENLLGSAKNSPQCKTATEGKVELAGHTTLSFAAPCVTVALRMKSTRFAIATTDGVSVCDHLARSASFVVLEMEGGREMSRTARSRESDACGNHRSFVELLAGCGAVICGGIGQGAVDALAAHGTESVVLAGRMTIEDAIAGYMAGTLVTTNARVCLCG